MTASLRATVQLYRETCLATIQSFKRGWILSIVILGFAFGMLIAGVLLAPLGLAGGFALGAFNALVIGTVLGLVEQIVMGARPLRWNDVPRSIGQYFWEVIAVGFTIGFPLMLLQMALQANPYRSVLTMSIFFLVFLLLNPVPEIIYQRRHGAVTDILRESYAFILDNWIEWFLPLGIVLAPFGISIFFELSSQSGQMVGLGFWQLVNFPLFLLSHWLELSGLSPTISFLMALLLTPILAALILFFRGHLFAALYSSSHRQRVFRARTGLL